MATNEPDWYIIFVGLGYEARAFGYYNIIKDEIPYISIDLIPTKAMVRACHIKNDDLVSRSGKIGYITKEYQKIRVLPAANPGSHTLYLFCDFNGDATPLHEQLNSVWQTQAQNLQEENIILREALAKKDEDIRMLMTQSEMVTNQRVREYKKIKKVVGTELVSPESEETPED